MYAIQPAAQALTAWAAALKVLVNHVPICRLVDGNHVPLMYWSQPLAQGNHTSLM